MILGTSSTSAAATTTAGKAASDQNKLSGDLNRFLTLLVTQLQNQDPLEPLDANQFTSQLVQFASVEQQISQNANLEKLLAAQTSGGLTNAIGYLGKTIESKGTALALQDGSANASYTLEKAAAGAVAVVSDASGKMVFSTKVDPSAGRHAFEWDGRDTSGRSLPDGTYGLQIVAKSAAGASVPVTQTWFAQVTGVGSDANGTQLSVGNGSVRLADVLSIRESTNAGSSGAN